MAEQLTAAQKELQDKTLQPAGVVRLNAPVFLAKNI